MKRPSGRNVLDGGVLAEQIRGRDVVDVRIVDDVVECQLQPLDVACLRLDEDVEVFGRAGQAVQFNATAPMMA